MTRRIVRVAGLAVLLAIAVAGVAYATIPDSGGVIHGCYLPGNGVLRVIDADTGQTCKQAETSIDWNQSGHTGGTLFETVTATVPSPPTPPGPIVRATATCPPGSRVVGGGGHANPDTAGNVIATYAPDETSWTVTAAMNPFTPGELSLTAQAICASS